MNKKEIASRIRTLRGGRSVREVASGIGISPSALCMYEAGARTPRDDIKIRMAEYFGVSVDALFYAKNGHKS